MATVSIFYFFLSLSLSLLICKNPLKMFHSLFCLRKRKEGYNQLYLDYPNNKRNQRWNLIKNRKGKKRKKMLPISDTIFSFLPFFLSSFHHSFPSPTPFRREKKKLNRTDEARSRLGKAITPELNSFIVTIKILTLFVLSYWLFSPFPFRFFFIFSSEFIAKFRNKKKKNLNKLTSCCTSSINGL
ncbi:predicted protein [Lodderomyces elongisporus NRRL YB-4239]|uniref:Uncharacterized protein n=1 Tax=Lodderomyces elongisporus (strain ATCC 11503 / CBS 2605 / JCM 1781 / NBRC 1676 / NRRL YB-4239) TaxID=379508 RepID=A5DTD9_LODEL|nr:predicted protein [Lodderomyces elongisporus NRRL YB-4239]